MHCCRKTIKDDLERSRRGSSVKCVNNTAVAEAGRAVPHITPISASRVSSPNATPSAVKSRYSSSTGKSFPVCGDSFFDDRNEPDQSRSNWSFNDTSSFNVSSVELRGMGSNNKVSRSSFSFSLSALDASSFDLSNMDPPRDTPAISNSARSLCDVSPAAVSACSGVQRSLLSELQMSDDGTKTPNATSLRNSFPAALAVKPSLTTYSCDMQSASSVRTGLSQSVVKVPFSASSSTAAVTIPAGSQSSGLSRCLIQVLCNSTPSVSTVCEADICITSVMCMLLCAAGRVYKSP